MTALARSEAGGRPLRPRLAWIAILSAASLASPARALAAAVDIARTSVADGPLAGAAWPVIGVLCVLAAIAVLGRTMLDSTGPATGMRRAAARVDTPPAERPAATKLLETVLDNVDDLVGLKGRDGRYLFANAALARAMGMQSADLIGRHDRELMPEGAALLLDRAEREALALGAAVDEQTSLELAGRRLALRTSHVPLTADDGRITGVVCVARDVTRLIEEQERRLRHLRGLADAFGKAIELIDPFLLGHTQRVRDLSLALGRAMRLTADDLLALELAASLSQVGKMFVPRDLLTKEGRHTPEETAVMRTHILHAAHVVEGIPFEVPVTATLTRMHERLDGSGYPYGLGGGDIPLAARILAIADYFAARTAARSYRASEEPGHVLAQLKANRLRYDDAVTTMLERLLTEGDLPISTSMPPQRPDSESGTRAGRPAAPSPSQPA